MKVRPDRLIMANHERLAVVRLERGQHLRALQRRGLLRQLREATEIMCFPACRRLRHWARRQAPEIAQRQCQKPARAKCGRQWRQQTKRQYADANADGDPEARIVELLEIEDHWICRREQRHKVERHRGERYRLPGLRHERAGRHEQQPDRQAE